MKRRLFNIFAAVSLVLCIATSVLWVRSYWIADILTDCYYRPHDDQFIEIWPLARSECGGISFRVQTSHVVGPPRPYPWPLRQVDPARSYPILPLYAGVPFSYIQFQRDFRWNFGGLQIAHYDRRVGIPLTLAETHSNLTTPHAAWVAVFLILPSVWLRQRILILRLTRRRRDGLCLTCGYNLTGNISGVCPECGTAIPLRAEIKRATP